MTTRFGRAASILGVVAVGILLSASAALADVTISKGPYRGTVVRSFATDTTPGAAIPVAGTLVRDLGQSRSDVRLVLKPTPCSAATTMVALGQDQPASEPLRVSAAFASTTALPFSEKRNGLYTIQLCINGQPALEQSFYAAFPAPVVTGVAATAADRSIAVTWDDMTTVAPDLREYLVQRRIGDGDFADLAEVDASTPTYTDADLPVEGGDATYRVIARRPDVADAAPSGESTATFAAAPTDTTAPGGTDTGVTVPGGSTGTTAPGGGGSKSPTHVNPHPASGVVVRAPRVGMPSNAFFPPLLTPPKAADVDTGYNPELPYDERGSDDPVLPADELASSPTDDLPGRGLAIPVATALVLAVWAFHLRYLARASKPVYVDDYLPPVD